MKKAIIAIIVLLVFCITGCKDAKDELLERVQEKATEYDLEVESISISTVKVDGSPIYHYTLYCSGFDHYSPETMIDISRSFGGFRIEKNHTTYYLDKIKSDGDTYTIYEDYKEIYKNGDVYYDGSKPAKASKQTRTCPNCKGSGWVKTYTTNNPWEDATIIECPMCHGSGEVTD